MNARRYGGPKSEEVVWGPRGLWGVGFRGGVNENEQVLNPRRPGD